MRHLALILWIAVLATACARRDSHVEPSRAHHKVASVDRDRREIEVVEGVANLERPGRAPHATDVEITVGVAAPGK